MSIRLRSRRCLAGCVAAALLLVQVAAAAYACPTGVSEPSDTTTTVDMPSCDGHRARHAPPEQALLCKAHCQQGTETLQRTAAADVQVAPMLLSVLDWTPWVPVIDPPVGRESVVTASAAPPGSVPRFLNLLVLRH